MYGDSSWQQVAEHVGTKRPHQCMMHFVQLPIQDAFLEDMELGETAVQGDVAGGTGQPADTAPESPLCQLPADAVPFADAGNPVMAQVAFLAAMVGPKVAAAAAQAALAALTNDPMHGDAAKKVLSAEASEQAEQPNKDAAADALPAKDEAGDGTVAAAADPDTMQNSVRDKPVGNTNAAHDENGSVEVAADVTSADVEMREAEDAAVAEELEANGGIAGVQLEQCTVTEEQGQVQESTQETRQREDVSEKVDMSKGDEGGQRWGASAVDMNRAAATALGAAAVRAKLAVDQEEREIRRLVMIAVENQLKKLEAKVRQFEELEDVLEREREHIEHMWQQLFAERVQFQAAQLAVKPAPPAAGSAAQQTPQAAPPQGAQVAFPLAPERVQSQLAAPQVSTQAQPVLGTSIMAVPSTSMATTGATMASGAPQ